MPSRTVALILILALALMIPSAAFAAYLSDDPPAYARIPRSEVYVYASSNHADKYGEYPAENAGDGDLDTTWAESAKGNGAGEELCFEFGVQEIIGFRIWAGYHKSKDVYRKNARPRRIEVIVSDEGEETVFEVELKDTRSAQTVLFDQPLRADSLKIVLSTFYAGTKYKDTCITDVVLLRLDGKETPSDASDAGWAEIYRRVLSDYLAKDVYELGIPWIRLLDLDFDSTPELVFCIGDAHAESTYRVVSADAPDEWFDVTFSDDSLEEGNIFGLREDERTGERFWLETDIYMNQGSESMRYSRLSYAGGEVSLKEMFSRMEQTAEREPDFGERSFAVDGREVSASEYGEAFRTFWEGTRSVESRIGKWERLVRTEAQLDSAFHAVVRQYEADVEAH